MIADALRDSEKSTVEEAVEEAEEEVRVREKYVTSLRAVSLLILSASSSTPMRTRHSGRICLITTRSTINAMGVTVLCPLANPRHLRHM